MPAMAATGGPLRLRSPDKVIGIDAIQNPRVQVLSNALTRALNDVALLDHLPEADVAARASVEAALLVAPLLNASPAPLPLAATAALVALGPLSPTKQWRRGEERLKYCE